MPNLLQPGEPAPWFSATALQGNPDYKFDTVAGRWLVMLLAGSAAHPPVQAALGTLARHRALFDDKRACFFGVSIDPSDAASGRIAQVLPGIRWFLDYDRQVSAAFGAANPAVPDRYTPAWLLIDPALRVRARAALDDGEALFARLAEEIAGPPASTPAPVLVIPDIFPRVLCEDLIGRYRANGGEPSGFMRDVDGVTVRLTDPSHKRRADHEIRDQALIAGLKQRLGRTLLPMIHRAFQFEVTRIERFIVACYDAADGGMFRAHRDNTTAGTAHRRFACTINLNAEEYEGGDLRFPEFGPATYRAPTGGAVVFSCSLLHEALPVTRGTRYAFLPFLYDDAAARLRERNLGQVAPELQSYRSGLSPEEATAA